MAVTVIGVALYWVDNDPVAASLSVQSQQDDDSGQAQDSEAECIPGPANNVAQVEVSTRPTAPLTAEVTARLTVDGQPLTDAAPTASADMQQMPCAHTVPPIALQAVPGNPGLYQGQVKVVMVGTWKFIVRLDGGVGGLGAATMPMTTVSPQ